MRVRLAAILSCLVLLSACSGGTEAFYLGQPVGARVHLVSGRRLVTLDLDEEDLAALDGQDLESLFGIEGVSVVFDEAAWSARERLISSLAAVTGTDVDDAIVMHSGSLASSDWADTLSALGSPLDEEALLKAFEGVDEHYDFDFDSVTQGMEGSLEEGLALWLGSAL